VNPEKVSLFCFFASYLLALALEAAQLWRRSAVVHWVAWGVATAGLVAQTVYLVMRVRQTSLPPLLSSTHDWLLVLSWLAVVMYLFVQLVNPRVSLGVFVLPVVLLLVGSARFVSREPNTDLGESGLRPLGMFHASLLVIGMAGVFIGFIVSLMYLVQHRRLKRKQATHAGFELLSLETLSRFNWWAVILSVPLLTLGMATGVWLSLESAELATPIGLARWQFVVSGILWLGMAALFVWLLALRRPSGRLVAWRTMWACGFLIVTLVVLQLASGGGIHGSG